MPYIGRFAPSPTGELHFGSLLAAVGSYLQARSRSGRWLVRVEDIDPPREVEGSAEAIIAELARFGMRSDLPVLYQSSRLPDFEAAAQKLLDKGAAFRCACSRADLPASGIYPGTCRDGLPPGRKARSIRVRVHRDWITFRDGVQGEIRHNLAAECGDFVIWRADGLPAYQLAVVVDDAFQQVTEVVRGADLLESTARQIHLQRLLGLPTPTYCHLPLATDGDGHKLSKRLGSDPLSSFEPVACLHEALKFLGQNPPVLQRLDELWAWALDHWSLGPIPRTRCG